MTRKNYTLDMSKITYNIDGIVENKINIIFNNQKLKSSEIKEDLFHKIWMLHYVSAIAWSLLIIAH